MNVLNAVVEARLDQLMGANPGAFRTSIRVAPKYRGQRLTVKCESHDLLPNIDFDEAQELAREAAEYLRFMFRNTNTEITIPYIKFSSIWISVPTTNKVVMRDKLIIVYKIVSQ